MIWWRAVTDLPVKVIAELVSDQDDPLVAAARQLANRSIEIALWHLEHGSPQLQLQVIKSIMPAIGRGLGQRSEAEELAGMRNTLEELMGVVMGQKSA